MADETAKPTPAKFDGLKPVEAKRLLKQEQDALRKKVARGHVLTAGERAILSKIASGDSGESSALKWVRSKVDLASALGVNRRTIERWFDDETHPSAAADGRYNVEEWREWAAKEGKKTGDSTPSQTSLKARQLLLQNQLLQDKIDVNKRHLIRVSDVEKMGADLGAAIQKVVAGLPTLAQSIVGCELREIEKILADKVDEIFDQLHVFGEALQEIKVEDIPAIEEEE